MVAVPDRHHRDLLLDQTGHAYLPGAGRISLVLLLAAVATLVGQSLASREPLRPVSVPVLAIRLGVVQTCAFVGLEVLERLLSRAQLDSLVTDHILIAGIAAQIVIALGGAVILRWLARASKRLAETLAVSVHLPRPIAIAMPSTGRSLALALAPRSACAPRAPPAA
jgi:hypothetical protein